MRPTASPGSMQRWRPPGIPLTCWRAGEQTPMRRLYFIQDFEPYFYGRGSMYSLAEDSYRFGFRCIALGQMVAGTLRSEVGIAPTSPSSAVTPPSIGSCPTAIERAWCSTRGRTYHAADTGSLGSRSASSTRRSRRSTSTSTVRSVSGLLLPGRPARQARARRAQRALQRQHRGTRNVVHQHLAGRRGDAGGRGDAGRQRFAAVPGGSRQRSRVVGRPHAGRHRRCLERGSDRRRSVDVARAASGSVRQFGWTKAKADVVRIIEHEVYGS